MQTRIDYLNDACHPTKLSLAGAAGATRRSKRTHTWHASYAVLALMTSLLLVSGCDKKDTAEQAAPPADKAVQTTPENAPAPSAGYPADPATTDPAMTPPASAPTPGTTPGNTPENPGENPSNTDTPMQQP